MALPAQVFARGRDAGVFVALDPEGLAVIYTGILQSYLLHEVIGLDRDPSVAPSSISREELHALLDRVFLASSGSAPR